MKKTIAFLNLLICLSTSLMSQVIIDYNEIEGNFVKEDIFNFSIKNKTEVKVEALLRGTITTPDEEVIFQFEVSNLSIEKGNSIFNKDSFNLVTLIDNYSKEKIKDGFKIECSLLHPLDRKSVIAKHSTYYIANEVGIEKGIRKNLANLIKDGFHQKKDYDITFYQPSKYYEPREFVIGIDNIFSVRVSKFNFPHRGLSQEVSPSNIKLYSDDKGIIIKRNSEGEYKLKVERAYGRKNISLKVKVIQEDYFFEREFFFGLRKLNRPTPYLIDKSGARIGKEDLIKFEELKVRFDKEFINTSYKIIEFYFLIIKKNGLRFKHKNQGSILQSKAKVKLKELEEGDIVIFDKIRCQYPGEGFPRHLEKIIIYK